VGVVVVVGVVGVEVSSFGVVVLLCWGVLLLALLLLYNLLLQRRERARIRRTTSQELTPPPQPRAWSTTSVEFTLGCCGWDRRWALVLCVPNDVPFELAMSFSATGGAGVCLNPLV
jgi:hypothetical protein